MGTTLVMIFFGLFALALVQILLRSARNPYEEIAYDRLPEELREEVDRVVPGFVHATARMRRLGDVARLDGDYRGRAVAIEAEFDEAGQMIDFEVDTVGGARTWRTAAIDEVPQAALREIERVLGEAAAAFQRRVVLAGTAGDESHYEVKGLASDWEWEIAVTEGGRLLEVERERRRLR